MDKKVSVIGAGLAGCEAAWQLSRAGIAVELFEMKPKKFTPAHKYKGFAELVCSAPHYSQKKREVYLLRDWKSSIIILKPAPA